MGAGFKAEVSGNCDAAQAKDEVDAARTVLSSPNPRLEPAPPCRVQTSTNSADLADASDKNLSNGDSIKTSGDDVPEKRKFTSYHFSGYSGGVEKTIEKAIDVNRGTLTLGVVKVMNAPFTVNGYAVDFSELKKVLEYAQKHVRPTMSYRSRRPTASEWSSSAIRSTPSARKISR
jgi:hypothetical protein